MNKKLYEAVFYRLQTTKATAISTLQHLMVDEPFCQSETVEEAEQLLYTISLVEAGVHELQQRYKGLHESPLAADQEKTKASQRWAELDGRLARIEAHVNPSPPTAKTLGHDELLERSAAYRESQQVGPGVVVTEAEEE